MSSHLYDLASDALPDLIPHGSGPFAQPLLAERMTLGQASAVDASQILAAHQRHVIQALATAMSSLSIAATLVAVYWFCMMRRNFRRDLVLLLLVGDFLKSVWFMVFSTYTFVHGQVDTDSSFCQANGYFLQAALIACDLSIMLMSLHMYLQIFPPKNSYIAHDGLYRIRGWMYAGWVVLPLVDASLAFVNSGSAYVASGPFCALPIRPFWYRLALSWIPRYLIWLFIMGVAIRIYMHVGLEFKVFGEGTDGSSSFPPTSSGLGESAMTNETTHVDRDDMEMDHSVGGKHEDDIAPDRVLPSLPASGEGLAPSAGMRQVSIVPPSQRHSFPSRHSHDRHWTPNWTIPFGPAAERQQQRLSDVKAEQTSRRGSHPTTGVIFEDFASHGPEESALRRGSEMTAGSAMASSHTHSVIPPPLRRSTSSGSSTANHAAHRVIHARRKAIQRQLRLLFIYPVVYIIMWIIPFVVHCMNYSDYYAQNPIYALAILSTICQTIMGFVDVAIFSWRERPWRHIVGSDGTLPGSFHFWTFTRRREWIDTVRRESRAPSRLGPIAKHRTPGSQSSTLFESIKRWSMGRKTSSVPSHKTTTTIVGSPATTPPLPQPAVNPAVIALRTRPPPPPAAPAITSTPTRPPHRRGNSAISDRRRMEVDRAHQRLALERADRERTLRQEEFDRSRRSSAVSVGTQGGAGAGADGKDAATSSATMPTIITAPPSGLPVPRHREWWDRNMSLFQDADVGVEDEEEDEQDEASRRRAREEHGVERRAEEVSPIEASASTSLLPPPPPSSPPAAPS